LREQPALKIVVFCSVAIGTPLLRRRIGAKSDGSLADDAEQEFYLFLREEDCRRLRAFRGASEREFRGYIRILALNFFSSQSTVRRRGELREAAARLAAARPEVAGPTEPQVLAVLREFVAITPPERRCRLSALLDPESDPATTDLRSRTLRRWQHEFVVSYLKRVL
jgi:hypothetical protein